jgi:hypothetical protein
MEPDDEARKPHWHFRPALATLRMSDFHLVCPSAAFLGRVFRGDVRAAEGDLIAVAMILELFADSS